MSRLTLVFALLASSYGAWAQIDTISYPKERKEVRQLMRHPKTAAEIDCDDFIAVGPKGDISFSHQQWKQVQAQEKVVFKSVRVVPGNEIIRIYEGRMAVVNFLADVQLVVNGREVNLLVRRLEVYRKSDTGWCRLAGQGTQVDETLFPVKRN